jgi:probable glucitol transport protein GutA
MEQSDQKMKTKTKNLEGKVGIKRMLFWQSRAISMGSNLLVMGFLTIYCTDTLMMPAALVGLLLMASKIFDGITDLFAGYIVDRTNTRLGRGRPYELCIIGVWLCTWLMFSCPPEFSMAAKGAWIFAMYAFVKSIFTTLLNAGNTVYMVRAFAKQEQYIAIQSYGSLVVMFFAVAVNVSFPILMAKIATSAQGWSALLAIYAIPLCLIGLLRFFFIKETNNVDITSGEKIRLKDVGTILKTNRYIYIVSLTTLVANLVSSMGTLVYYFTYIVKDVALMGPMALIQVILLPLVFLFPPIIKKFSTGKLIIAGLLFVTFGYLINFFARDNFILLVCGQIFIGGGNVPLSMMTALLIIDCAEYNEWKKNPRMEGTLTCINGFADKIGSAFGAGMTGVLLGIAGYTGSMSTVPDSAITMIRLLYSLIPIGLYIVVIIVFRFYKLDKLIVQIRRENEESRQDRHPKLPGESLPIIL